jgi:UDP-2,4-diacetamido-2,4,6-trideoxy-beta-L-altropyranose hydrolase
VTQRSATPCRLRPAEPEDAAQLYVWVNRPDSIASSLTTKEAVSWEEHQRWFAARLSDPRSILFVVEVEGTPVGQLRLQDKGEGPEVAIYIAPPWRNSGIATNALEAGLREARSRWPGALAIARVRRDNARSQRLFERSGFVPAAIAPDHIVYRRLLPELEQG